MFKGARKDRTAHTRQKPKPRFVSKAHRLEQDEHQSAHDAAPRPSERPKNKTAAKR